MQFLPPPPQHWFSQGFLLAGQIVYHGPKEHVLEFFEGLGFQLPHRKGIADFLQAFPPHYGTTIQYVAFSTCRMLQASLVIMLWLM